VHKTAEQLAALYTSAATRIDLSHAWINSIADRMPMSAHDFKVCAEAFMNRRERFVIQVGTGDRGA
jgi:hypothetical protein